jgi:hypothetical protein
MGLRHGLHGSVVARGLRREVYPCGAVIQVTFGHGMPGSLLVRAQHVGCCSRAIS